MLYQDQSAFNRAGHIRGKHGAVAASSYAKGESDISMPSSDPITITRTILREAVTKKRLDVPRFFDRWFRTYGAAYFFLFRKNLKVTNMQFAELHSLLRTHLWWKDSGSRVRDFQLLSINEFNQAVGSLLESFSRLDVDQAIDKVSELYGHLVKEIVCIQPYFGSCSVFIPYSMSLKLLPLCAESGYIHSCGTLVLQRNVAKITKTQFYGDLKRYLSNNKIKKARLIVYAHEDFSPIDRRDAPLLRDGLDVID